MATIEQIFYTYLNNDTQMQAAFNEVSYILNDKKAKEPYACLWLVDDNQDTLNICLDQNDQGEARFSCEVYAKSAVQASVKRATFKEVCRAFEGNIENNIRVWKVSIQAVSDSPTRINGLFTLTFEAVLSWELDT